MLIVLHDEFNDVEVKDFNYAAWIGRTHTGNTGNNSYIRELYAATDVIKWNGSNWQLNISAHILYYNSYQSKDMFSEGYVNWYVLA